MSKPWLCLHFCALELLFYKAFGLVSLSYFFFKKCHFSGIQRHSLGRFKIVSSTDLKMQSLQGWQCGGPFPEDFFGESLILFISSHHDDIKSCMVKFAVGAKVPGLVNNKEDIFSLQRNLNHLVKCFQCPKMCFNAVKCKLVHKSTSYANRMEDYLVKLFDFGKDIGVE